MFYTWYIAKNDYQVIFFFFFHGQLVCVMPKKAFYFTVFFFFQECFHTTFMTICVLQMMWVLLWCILKSFMKLLSIQLLQCYWGVIGGAHWTLNCCFFVWVPYFVEVSASLVRRVTWNLKCQSLIPANGNWITN